MIQAEDVEKKGGKLLNAVDGIIVPGGFGDRGINGKIAAIRYARENKIPFLGICLGMHCAAIEFARHVCGWEDANSTEFNPETKYPVIDVLPEQREIKDLGAPCALAFILPYCSALWLQKFTSRKSFMNATATVMNLTATSGRLWQNVVC